MAKMTNKELQAMLQEQNERLAKLESMLQAEKSARELAESKVEAAEQTAAEAERKRKDALEKAVEFKKKLEAKEAEGPVAQFDASIKCDFDFTVYAVPELGRLLTAKRAETPAHVEVSAVDMFVNEYRSEYLYTRCVGQVGPNLVFTDMHRTIWSRREKTPEEFMHDVKCALRNIEYKNNLPRYAFPGDVQRIKRALPNVSLTSKKTTAVKEKKTTAGSAYGRVYDFSKLNNEMDNDRHIEPVARGYMFKEGKRPLVRILLTKDGTFKLCTRVNIKCIETADNETELVAALKKYTIETADQYA